jgi:hypothetical protein
MINASIPQILNIWSQLWKAYYNDNKIGGDTAEIYGYTLCPYTAVPKFHDENCQIAAADLYEILTKFAKDNKCKIFIKDGKHIDEKKIGTWIKDMQFHHRIHIKVER